MSGHSHVVGGSTSARVLACPGSVKLIESLPEIIEQPSSYATEGSALHQVVAEILINADRGAEDFIGTEVVVKDEGTVTITEALVKDCIEPVLDWFDHNISETAHLEVEQRVAFPGIPGAFGFCDLLACDQETATTDVVDFKFGAGIQVLAAYPDPDDPEFEIINSQLLFYACAARNSLPHLFPEFGRIRLSIVQPRARSPEGRVTSVIVEHADLDAFEKALQAAIERSQQPDAPIKLGDHCRFAVCKTACPLHLAPLLDLAEVYPLEEVKRQTYDGAVLADILKLAELVEPVITEARRQVRELLEVGGDVPGWRLVPKRANRSWAVDDSLVLAELRKLKISKAQAMSYALKSPAQIEKLLRDDAELPDKLVAKISNGSTIAKATDPRPDAPSIGAAVAEIVDALEHA